MDKHYKDNYRSVGRAGRERDQNTGEVGALNEGIISREGKKWTGGAKVKTERVDRKEGQREGKMR